MLAGITATISGKRLRNAEVCPPFDDHYTNAYRDGTYHFPFTLARNLDLGTLYTLYSFETYPSSVALPNGLYVMPVYSLHYIKYLWAFLYRCFSTEQTLISSFMYTVDVSLL